MGDLTGYRTWVFDCDGVLLDSNVLKTEAFRAEAEPFGPLVAEEFVRYHQAHGGVSRQVKARFLFEQILGRTADAAEIDKFLRGFAQRVRAGLAAVRADDSLLPLLLELRRRQCRLFVVTGGDEGEVRHELHSRGLIDNFAGVYGSPRSKPEILAGLDRAGLLERPGALVGDGALDADCAERFGLDFVFVEHWSEWAGWQEQLPGRAIVVHDLAELLALLPG